MSEQPLVRQLETIHQQAAALLERAQVVAPHSLREWTVAEPSRAETLRQTWHELTDTLAELLNVHAAYEAQRPRYLDLVEFAPNGYLITDTRGLIQEADEAVAALFHYPHRELVGQLMTAFVVPGEAWEFEQDLAPLADTIYSKYRETRLQNRYGVPIDGAYVVVPERDAQGRVARLRWLIWDISERKRSDQALVAARQSAEQTAERIARLQAVIAGLADALTAEQVLAVVVQHGASALGTVSGALNVLSADGGHLRLEGVGYAQGVWATYPEFALSEAMPGADALRSGEPLLFGSRGEFSTRYPHLAEEAARAEAVAAFPLAVDHRPIGALVFSFGEPRSFTPGDQAYLVALAGLSAQALARSRALRLENSALRQEMAERTRSQAENARDLAQLRTLTADLTLVREEERRRLALELHDQLGGALTALKMDVYLLRRALGEREPAVLDRLGTMADSISGTLTLVRDLATELRPPMLDDLGLPASLEWAAGEFQTRFGIACRWVTNTDTLTLDAPRATAIFRAVQECLTNIVRHAEATEVTITLLSQPAVLVVSVRDNGKGFRYSPATHGRSVGLAGLQERIQAIGGSLGIESAPGQGTLVIMTLAPQRPA